MRSAGRRQRWASFLVPLLTFASLLYAVLASLHVTVLRAETLALVAGWLGAGLVFGLLAAVGGERVRILVLSLMVVIWADATFGLSKVLDVLDPEVRALGARDRQRLDDIRAIQLALERHVREIGPLPQPGDYGEAMGLSYFWENWWDVSSIDGNGNGRPFLEFLEDRGLMTKVPVDPINRPSADANPTRGQQYSYFVVPAGYIYEGGQCGGPGASTFLLAVTDLERESQRPPTGVTGSGCECLWKDKPDFFQPYFDYFVCGPAS